MTKYTKLNDNIPDLQNRFGDRYFIFIAPFDLIECKKLNIFNHYVYHQIQAPEEIFKQDMHLDIYFVNYEHISGMNISRPLTFNRLSETKLNSL